MSRNEVVSTAAGHPAYYRSALSVHLTDDPELIAFGCLPHGRHARMSRSLRLAAWY